MQLKRAIITCSALGLALLLSASNCGPGTDQGAVHQPNSPTPATPAATREALNRYFAGLGAISAGMEVQVATGPEDRVVTEPYDDSDAESGKRRYQCTSTPYSITKNPDKIVTLNPDANKLWLGSLLQGAGYAGGMGSLRELPIRERAPLKIYMDLLGEDVVAEVAKPGPDSTQAAIGRLVGRAKAERTTYPTRVSFEQVDANSSEEALLKLGFSVRYLGAKVSAHLDSTTSAQESSVTATFVQRLFTISMVVPQSPADYFTSGFTMEDIREQEQQGRIALDNPPVVLASIAFGRILLYNITAKATKVELSAALSAAYGGGVSGSIDLDARQQEILNKARYSVVALGGDENAALNLIKDRKLGEYFSANTDLANAVPISYQVNNIGNDSAAKFSETTSYIATECAALPNNARDVGDIVRIENFRGYVDGPCDYADIYGSLSINGEVLWNQPTESQHPRRWTEFSFDNMRPPTPMPLHPDYKQTVEPWEYAMSDGSALHVSGSVQDAQGIFKPSVNIFDWTLPHPIAIGEQQIDGGSVNCRVLLRFTVAKKADLYAYTP